MWDPQRLTTLWAFTACNRDSFIYYLLLIEINVQCFNIELFYSYNLRYEISSEILFCNICLIYGNLQCIQSHTNLIMQCLDLRDSTRIQANKMYGLLCTHIQIKIFWKWRCSYSEIWYQCAWFNGVFFRKILLQTYWKSVISHINKIKNIYVTPQLFRLREYMLRTNRVAEHRAVWEASEAQKPKTWNGRRGCLATCFTCRRLSNFW
jgi:hypothetical protein